MAMAIPTKKCSTFLFFFRIQIGTNTKLASTTKEEVDGIFVPFSPTAYFVCHLILSSQKPQTSSSMSIGRFSAFIHTFLPLPGIQNFKWPGKKIQSIGFFCRLSPLSKNNKILAPSSKGTKSTPQPPRIRPFKSIATIGLEMVWGQSQKICLEEKQRKTSWKNEWRQKAL
jgi:hypothetical protein